MTGVQQGLLLWLFQEGLEAGLAGASEAGMVLIFDMSETGGPAQPQRLKAA